MQYTLVTRTEYKAHPIQGLTCFHDYHNPNRKTMSIDMLYVTLDNLETTTSLLLGGENIDIHINYGTPNQTTIDNLTSFVRRYYPTGGFEIESTNNFEMDVGLASSGSGYACLAACINELLQISESPDDISRIARSGSFSASASVSGGISLIEKENDFAYGIEVFSPQEMADMEIVISLAGNSKENHNFYSEAKSSPFLATARDKCQSTAGELIAAFKERDIDKLAYLSENHVTLNYAVLQTGQNNKFLWRSESVKTMEIIRSLRSEGNPMFYSMNTGGNVFVYSFDETKQLTEALEYEQIDYKQSKVGGGVQRINQTW